jgi:hypothetical protein
MSVVVPVSGAWMPRRHCFVVAVCALVLVVAGALMFGASAARAGQWAQIACQNPDGSSSNAQGWTQQINGSPAAGSSQPTSDVQCDGTNPINDVLYGDNAGETIIQETYSAPANSTLVGGSISGALSAWGAGGLGVIYSPADTMDAADEVAICQEGAGCPAPGARVYSGKSRLPRGTTLKKPGQHHRKGSDA